MTTLWTTMFVSFKSEAVSYSIISNANSTSYPDSVDYDTVETVTCSSKFLYNSMRQRSLQHFIEIEELPLQYGIVDLPSGVSRSCLSPLTDLSTFIQVITPLVGFKLDYTGSRCSIKFRWFDKSSSSPQIQIDMFIQISSINSEYFVQPIQISSVKVLRGWCLNLISAESPIKNMCWPGESYLEFWKS